MCSQKRNILFVNFNGIGNGILILPLLKRLEEVESSFTYFHTSNPIFETSSFMNWFDLRNFRGVVPTHWRRFAEADWDAIKNFLQEEEVDLIINLRNEGPLRDVGYFRFKEEMSDSNIEFWNVEQNEIENRLEHRRLIEDHINLFNDKGIDIASFNKLWLRDYLEADGKFRPGSGNIGFFSGASQEVKRWAGADWVDLGRLILDKTDHNITVYAGRTEVEFQIADFIVKELQREFSTRRCAIFDAPSLELLCADLSGLEVLVSNDTSGVHMGAALDIPTIGLYFSTDSNIWGGISAKFSAVQSQFGLQCKDLKRDAGNCNFYYGGCPAPCKDEITSQVVFNSIERYLKTRITEKYAG